MTLFGSEFDSHIESIRALSSKITEARAENQRLQTIISKQKDALEFYGNADNWIDGKPMTTTVTELPEEVKVEGKGGITFSGSLTISNADNGKIAREALALTATDKDNEYINKLFSDVGISKATNITITSGRDKWVFDGDGKPTKSTDEEEKPL